MLISFCWNALLISPADGKPVTAWYGRFITSSASLILVSCDAPRL